jgi:hypothetical protein
VSPCYAGGLPKPAVADHGEFFVVFRLPTNDGRAVGPIRFWIRIDSSTQVRRDCRPRSVPISYWPTTFGSFPRTDSVSMRQPRVSRTATGEFFALVRKFREKFADEFVELARRAPSTPPIGPSNAQAAFLRTCESFLSDCKPSVDEVCDGADTLEGTTSESLSKAA